MTSLSPYGFAPLLHGRFTNGFVYGYFEGKPFSVGGTVKFCFFTQDMSDPMKSSLVAKHLSEWHDLEIPGNKSPALFNSLKRWLAGGNSYVYF
jgi:hypothetical protein